MSKKLLLLLAAAAVISACSLDAGNQDQTASKETAIQRTAETLVLISEGDEEVLDAYLAENDPDGEIRRLLDQKQDRDRDRDRLKQKSLVSSSTPDWDGDEPMPSDFAPGDVAVFQGKGDTWQNTLMNLVLVDQQYLHAGIVWQIPDYDLDGTGDEVVFLSASIETAADGTQINGLAIQTLSQLKETSVRVAQLRYDTAGLMLDVVMNVFASFYFNPDGSPKIETMYSFVSLNSSTLLAPVADDDPVLWYCSKVPWVMFQLDISAITPGITKLPLRGYPDIEYTDYYFESGLWKDQRQSILYKILVIYLKIETRKSFWWCIKTADAIVKDTLNEVVTPDELRANAEPLNTWNRIGYAEDF